MRVTLRSTRLVLACLPVLATAGVLISPASTGAQGPSVAAPAPLASALSLTPAARENFLANARIVKARPASKGTTNTMRVTLTDGTLTHDASVQTIEVAKAVFETPRGTEFNFKDDWRFNLAAYRIDRLLSLGMIPATVERYHNSRPGSFTWWVDDVLMDEQERYQQKKKVPDTDDWNQQMWTTRLFDQLIANVDRNLGNLLIDKSYNIWMIDHSRAFRLNKTLRSPESLSKVDRGLLERLRQLNRENLRREVGRYLTDAEIDAFLHRRDRIVEHYDKAGTSLLFDRRARCC